MNHLEQTLLRTEEIAKYIEIKNNVAYVKGSNLRVFRVIIWHKQNLTNQEIAFECNLSIEQVNACLAYYVNNQEAIDAKIESENLQYENYLKLESEKK